MRFRCTREDYDVTWAKAQATGKSLSEYLRKRATGGHVSQPIQDFNDMAELRQHLGLLKMLVKENRAVRPLLQSLEALIQKMSEKIG